MCAHTLTRSTDIYSHALTQTQDVLNSYLAYVYVYFCVCMYICTLYVYIYRKRDTRTHIYTYMDINTWRRVYEYIWHTGTQFFFIPCRHWLDGLTGSYELQGCVSVSLGMIFTAGCPSWCRLVFIMYWVFFHATHTSEVVK